MAEQELSDYLEEWPKGVAVTVAAAGPIIGPLAGVIVGLADMAWPHPVTRYLGAHCPAIAQAYTTPEYSQIWGFIATGFFLGTAASVIAAGAAYGLCATSVAACRAFRERGSSRLPSVEE